MQTIIECLKVSCTGELPPNIKHGQYFIYDPKIAGETEVKARIKLRFYDAQQNPFIIVRSFQLTQTKKTMQFKALDTTLSTFDPETGQMAALPHRCGDINALVPCVLGVSKAILENVIFVHQEDSNWPLGDAKTLKKNFDEIFAASRYTKVLEDLRKTRTKNMQDVREMNLQLEHLKTLKDHAASLRASAAENSRRADNLREEIEEIDRKISDIVSSKKNISSKLDHFSELKDEVNRLKTKQQIWASKNAETRARLSDVYSSDDLDAEFSDLEDLEKSLGPSLLEFKEKSQKLGEELNDKDVNLRQIKDEREEQSAKRARILAEIDVYNRNKSHRDAFLRQLARDYSFSLENLINSNDGEFLADNTADQIKRGLNDRLKDAELDLMQAREEHRQKNAEIASQIDAVSLQLKNTTDLFRVKDETLDKNTKKIRELQVQLEGLRFSNPETYIHIEAKLDATEAKLKDKQQELDASCYEKEVEQATSDLAGIAVKIDKLRSERTNLANYAEDLTRIDIKTQEVRYLEEKTQSLLSNFRAELAILLDVGVSEVPSIAEELQKSMDIAMDKTRGNMDQRTASLNEHKAVVTKCEAQEKSLENQLQKAKDEMANLSKRLASHVSQGKNIRQELESIELQKKKTANKVQHGGSVEIILEGQIKYARETCSCSTCNRAFANTQERDQVIARLEEQKSELPSAIEQHKALLKEAEDRLKSLRELEPLAIRHDFLRDEEIPPLNRELKMIRMKISQHQAELMEAEESYENAKTSVDKIQKVMQDVVVPYCRSMQDITQRKEEIENLKESICLGSATRTVSEIDTELGLLENDRIVLQDQKDQATSELMELREIISILRTDAYNVKQELNELKSLSEKRSAIETEIEILIKKNEDLVNEISNQKHEAQPLKDKKEALQSIQNEADKNARKKEAELEQALRDLQTRETQLLALESNLNDFEKSDTFKDLEVSEIALNELEESQMEYEEKIKSISESLSTLQKSISECEMMARQIAEVKAYRQSVAEEATINEELKLKVDCLGSTEEHISLEKTLQDLNEEEKLLQSEVDKKSGSLATYRQMSIKDSNELKSKEYDDIENRYSSQVIKKFITELAVSDLDKYHKALERAILSYHTTKMADINKTVKELWQKTYRGTDIDYIQIRADTDGGAARSYNYRVIMVCRGAELDMRGRCSAGQRVLACLIIRLALAETFCLNCGILALDEPTTNLDQENAEALAESLKSIMLARREQENFQLIVITHDEQFAAAIGTREHADYRWRVSKDAQQNSTLTKEEVFG